VRGKKEGGEFVFEKLGSICFAKNKRFEKYFLKNNRLYHLQK